jgi:endonuclease/exonuclease/phosphatase family metal-dependent hydrolase
MALVMMGEVAVRLSPSWFPWLAPFGLTYGLGWLLLATGVVWRVVSFRWIRAAFPTLILLATWPSFMLVFSLGLGAAQTPMDEEDWGVLSFNVRRLDEFDWLEGDATRRALAQWLSDRKESVWCLQEFPTNGKAVLEGAGFSWSSPRRTLLSWPGGAGPSMVTTLPIEGWDTWMFPEDAGRGRVLQADVQTPSGTVRVFNVHLQSLYFSHADYAAVEDGPSRQEGLRLLSLVTQASKARAKQAHFLREKMAESPHPVVLAGDFNDTPMSYAVRQLREGRVRDAFESAHLGLGGTHIGTVPGLRIDGILVDTTLVVHRHETHGVVLSDHHPVSAWVGSGVDLD